MNKTDLINAVAMKADMTKQDAEKAVTQVFKVIEESMCKGRDSACRFWWCLGCLFHASNLLHTL
ncbi:hypothetical protein SBF1_510002 [Candidatus Desulfosporosinus infrequens]|uniref:DNA-binding protein HU n=1 Tax=Candidatus Desulfosporosinus infrequens TaxID=2043169 RepID=A0A2U3LHX4_9FIRM|nr:hypothetical protein SBF1_510002 [Candidatus Desulfosporosinus infrequens]